ncbi:hypothetical protein [Acidovorax sp.]|uniref:hypothetical protein n=1 Tax=Acidovorax sp. TaxID=1872122 RepID=UPI002ACE1A96|nr:hypothetical protein [Acidovorax sp.]MDZ7863316.1 hypothetical protein [Acidovorax sp.]
MLFGTEKTFAIEAMSEPDLAPPSAVWGRMRVWCQGMPIGDFFAKQCALYPSYVNFRLLRERLALLWLAEFEGMSAISLWNHLDGLLYGFHGDVELTDVRTLEECRQASEKYGRFDFLTNWGEQFDDNGKSFILCTPAGEVKVLNWSLAKEEELRARLPDVLQSISEFMNWFESEARRLNGGPKDHLTA